MPTPPNRPVMTLSCLSAAVSVREIPLPLPRSFFPVSALPTFRQSGKPLRRFITVCYGIAKKIREGKGRTSGRGITIGWI